MSLTHLNGEETFREIRSIRPDARVILSGGYQEQDAVYHFKGVGLAGFLQKPFELEELIEKVQHVLAQKV